jgi:hypothetical protein
MAAAALFVTQLAAQTPAVQVWAASDGVRVNTVNGKAFESRPDIHKDYPTGDLHGTNSVWNAASKTVSLKAARNEFIAFQVIAEAPHGAAEVSAKFPALTGPHGARIDGKFVAVFKEWYVEVRRATTGMNAARSVGGIRMALMPLRRSDLYTVFPSPYRTSITTFPIRKSRSLD